MTRLSGRVVIVTGAERDLVKALAVGMARERAFIIIAALHEENGLQVQKEMEELSERAMTIVTDVCSELSVNTMVNQCMEEFGHIDVLINAADIDSTSPVEKMPEEDWDRVIENNLQGAFLCSKAITPIMLEQRKGRIISMTSEAAFRGRSKRIPLCGIKSRDYWVH